MKIINYTSVTPTHFDNDQAKGVAGHVVVGKNDGANNFCMRIFEIASGGYTPKHAHPWNMKCLFMLVLAKFTAMTNGIKLSLELLYLCRLMKNIKFAISEKNY